MLAAPPPEPSAARRAPGDPSRLFTPLAACRPLSVPVPVPARPVVARLTSHIPQPLRVTCSHHCDRHTAQVSLFGSFDIAGLIALRIRRARTCHSIDSSQSPDSPLSHHQLTHSRTVPLPPRPAPVRLNPWHLLGRRAFTKRDDIRGFLFEHH